MKIPPGRPGRAVLVAAAGLGGIALLYMVPPEAARQPSARQELALPTRHVEYESVAIPVHSRATVRAARRIPLVSEVGGRVADVADAFRDGGIVSVGDTLVELEQEPFELDIARRRNKVRAAELHRARTRANASVARKNNSGGSDYARFEPQMAEARSRVEAARAGLRKARRRLEQARIEAPFDGRLEQVAVQSDQYIQAGTRLAHLYSTGQLELRLPVRDDWLRLLGFSVEADAGTPDIRVELSGHFAGRQGRWDGRVVRREGGLNPNQMTFLVVRVEKPKQASPPLEPGVFVQAELMGEPLDHVAVLPRSALAGNNRVWILDDEHRLRRRAVDIVYRDEDHLYVTGGLRARAEVVKAGGLRVPEGTRIRPLGAEANAVGAAPPDSGGESDLAQH